MTIHQAVVTIDSKADLARNRYLPERTIQTGLGEIEIKARKSRD